MIKGYRPTSYPSLLPLFISNVFEKLVYVQPLNFFEKQNCVMMSDRSCKGRFTITALQLVSWMLLFIQLMRNVQLEFLWAYTSKSNTNNSLKLLKAAEIRIQ